MSNFDTYFDAADLWKNGRKNAAKAKWLSLPELFRKAMLLCAIEAMSTRKEVLEQTYGVTIASPEHGQLTFCSHVINDIILVSELANG